jgi:hypothetical protein
MRGAIDMAFDFKKEYKEFYLPPVKPEIVDVPSMKYIAVQGAGDPNIEGGEYQTAIGLLNGKQKSIFERNEKDAFNQNNEIADRR